MSLALAFAPLLALATPAQEKSAAPAALPWAAQVDSLFTAWDKPDSPGCALGVIQDGVLVHARGFGQASLEHSVAINPHTIFDIGSTSKQFTAACIGLLVQENKVGVEDDVRSWIPELQDFGDVVTIDHMLHHTSGLPDYLGLLFGRGHQTADWTTPKEALDELAKVKRLLFRPGERFEYSNTNYFLLSLIIERTSEMGMARFANERLFAPLGMTHTLLLDDHTLVVPHRATAYLPRRSGGFGVEMSDFEQLGDGAVQTSVEDLLRWDGNFYSKQVGGEELQRFLHQTAPLNDGKPNGYARGLMVDTFHGLARVSHGGAWAGYRAQLMRFPEQKTSIVLLCNLGTMDPNGLCELVAMAVLGKQMRAEK